MPPMLQWLVRDHIPLEQGLRQGCQPWRRRKLLRQRPYSIRTRIKTSPGKRLHRDPPVRDHIPLEQGLRQLASSISALVSACQRPYSIRTRIKTLGLCLWQALCCEVRDHIPLEQGLRQHLADFSPDWLRGVRDHIPLEQGLRPCLSCSVSVYWGSETIFH